MRELTRVWRVLAECAQHGEGAMLATVLRVEGSVYRGRGARMVVREDGSSVGAVSGGCLEADIIARAPECLGTAQAELVTYDTRAEDDGVLGLGLGCQGVLDVLLEPLAGTSLDSAIALLRALDSIESSVTLRTGLAGGLLGRRAVLDATGALIEGDARLLSATPVADETIQPAPRLLVCGAGADAMPLVALAESMGWRTTVADHRAALLTSERFPGASLIAVSDDHRAVIARVIAHGIWSVVVMAHSAAHDRAWLESLSPLQLPYLGVLGPRRRTLELLGLHAGASLPPGIHSPIGLDVGAETPEEIALAIVAEVCAVSRGRGGGMLRNHSGPIHPDRETPSAPREPSRVALTRQDPQWPSVRHRH